MSDPVDQDLRAWHDSGDQAAGTRALHALNQEWRPRIRRLLHHPSNEEVEDLLNEALLQLALSRDGEHPRALCNEARSPKAYRTTVLKNFVRDALRKGGTARNFRKVLHAGLNMRVGSQLNNEAKAARRAGNNAPVRELPSARPEDVASDPNTLVSELEMMRRTMVHLLPKLSIRRRVILAVSADIDPTPWVDELARDLERNATELATQLEAARNVNEEPPSRPLIVAMWGEFTAQTSDAARKTLSRAKADIIESLRADK